MQIYLMYFVVRSNVSDFDFGGVGPPSGVRLCPAPQVWCIIFFMKLTFGQYHYF